jgi:hypothetical protein
MLEPAQLLLSLMKKALCLINQELRLPDKPNTLGIAHFGFFCARPLYLHAKGLTGFRIAPRSRQKIWHMLGVAEAACDNQRVSTHH